MATQKKKTTSTRKTTVKKNKKEEDQKSEKIETPDSSKTETISDNDIRDIGYDPLTSEPVNKKSYTVPKVDASQLPHELAEPIFTPPSLDDFDEDTEDSEAAPEPEKSEKKTYQDFNPQFGELPNKEKKRGAEQIADIVIDGYGRLGKGMGMLAKISEEKLSREIAEDNIDENITLPIDNYGNTATITEFVQEFNVEAEAAFETTDEFKENVRPPLVRVFQKRGIGMTDEQMLIYYFGTDFATKGITLFQLKKAQNGILNNLKAQTEMMRKGEAPPTPKTASSSPPNKPPSPPVDSVDAEFLEPEEDEYTEAVTVSTDLDSVQSAKGFAENPKDPKMPEFGNEQVLEDMEKLAKREREKKK